MEKTFQLDQRESAMLQSLDQERTQALAAIGALSLDMETARKNLDVAQQKQQSFLRQAVMTRGVDRFENARMQNGALVVALPDAQPASALTAAIDKDIEKVNGAASIA